MSLINFITKVKNLFVVEKLGVGTDAPDTTVQIVANSEAESEIELLRLSNMQAGVVNQTVSMSLVNSGIYSGIIKGKTSANGTASELQFWTWFADAIHHAMTLKDKNVGVNNARPLVSLHISDGTTPQLYLSSGGDNATEKILSLYYDVANSRAGIQSVHNGTATTPLLLNPSGGNVGVNKVLPTEAFDVTGNIKASGNLVAVGDLSVGDDAGIIGDLTVSGKIINNSTRYQYNFDLDGASKSWTLFTLAMDTEFRKEIFVSGTYYGPPAHVNSRFDYTEFKAYIKDGQLGTGVIVKTFENITLPDDDPYVPSVGYTITLDGLDVVLTATGIATDDILDLYIQVR